MWKLLKPNHKNIRVWQLMVLLIVLLVWHVATRNPQTAFFFGEPLKVAQRIWEWFTSAAVAGGRYRRHFFTLASRRDLLHLLITLTEPCWPSASAPSSAWASACGWRSRRPPRPCSIPT
jgi:NitT/TauT family transport system permease protein